ncbi:MAG: hypothetical protein H7259_06725 [Cytophagales bacterium]|nr:hypothetical protein [Cytophaga sp.]
MKKLIVAASMLALCFSVSAQDYKPVAGDVTAEIGANVVNTGLSGSPFSAVNTNFPNNGLLRFRYFIADKTALRLGFNGSVFSRTVTGTTGVIDYKQTYKSSLLGLNLGIEKHFNGTERLSTYIGADLLFNFLGASSKGEHINLGGAVADNNGYKVKGTNGLGTASTGDDINSAFGFGLRAVTGADYYFAEKAYIGIEMGIGFISYKNGKQKTENTTTGTTTTTDLSSTGSSFELTPAASAAFRLGYRF